MATGKNNLAGNGDDGSEDDKVGYGKPPKHTRWKKGQSGNPKGRKKGSRGLKKDLDEALKATLTINVGGKKRKGTTQALAMYALAAKSATGDLRAIEALIKLVLDIFGPEDRGTGTARLSMQDQQLIERVLGRVEEELEADEPSDPASGKPEDGPANSDGNDDQAKDGGEDQGENGHG